MGAAPLNDSLERKYQRHYTKKKIPVRYYGLRAMITESQESNRDRTFKVFVLHFNILLESKINISLCTDLIFTDHLFIWEVNYRTIDQNYANIWEQPSYSNTHTLT